MRVLNWHLRKDRAMRDMRMTMLSAIMCGVLFATAGAYAQELPPDIAAAVHEAAEAGDLDAIRDLVLANPTLAASIAAAYAAAAPDQAAAIAGAVTEVVPASAAAIAAAVTAVAPWAWAAILAAVTAEVPPALEAAIEDAVAQAVAEAETEEPPTENPAQDVLSPS